MRVVLLGTGTGVGKTTAACSLCRAVAAKNMAVLGLKPVESGFAPTPSGAPAEGSDAALFESSVFHVQHPRAASDCGL